MIYTRRSVSCKLVQKNFVGFILWEADVLSRAGRRGVAFTRRDGDGEGKNSEESDARVVIKTHLGNKKKCLWGLSFERKIVS
jgi:hypothetical protein